MKYSRIPRVNRQVQGLILVGIIALVVHCVGILVPWVPCDRSIRLTGNASEIDIGNISGTHKVNTRKKLDLNVADESDLRAVPGIGPVLAGRIVSHRDLIGGFTSLEELKNIAGIRAKKFSQFSRFLEISDSFHGQKHVQSSLSFSNPPTGPDE
ncbi:ComEA family DNA-binding protein [Desulfomonile tiedjei]|uniref:Helix-hairpin-helix protein n=1 Tax=Desulfomonile tiedjei (strain ATCC 49306 / DSM 6799 / DCB-1) TaxID=706587 RepID=I4C7X4_DESTA|nr:helix-hairpin-helix protein [Desulfomonile tiedjei DSM 6799]